MDPTSVMKLVREQRRQINDSFITPRHFSNSPTANNSTYYQTQDNQISTSSPTFILPSASASPSLSQPRLFNQKQAHLDLHNNKIYFNKNDNIDAFNGRHDTRITEPQYENFKNPKRNFFSSINSPSLDAVSSNTPQHPHLLYYDPASRSASVKSVASDSGIGSASPLSDSSEEPKLNENSQINNGFYKINMTAGINGNNNNLSDNTFFSPVPRKSIKIASDLNGNKIRSYGNPYDQLYFNRKEELNGQSNHSYHQHTKSYEINNTSLINNNNCNSTYAFHKHDPKESCCIPQKQLGSNFTYTLSQQQQPQKPQPQQQQPQSLQQQSQQHQPKQNLPQHHQPHTPQPQQQQIQQQQAQQQQAQQQTQQQQAQQQQAQQQQPRLQLPQQQKPNKQHPPQQQQQQLQQQLSQPQQIQQQQQQQSQQNQPQPQPPSKQQPQQKYQQQGQLNIHSNQKQTSLENQSSQSVNSYQNSPVWIDR